MQYVPMALLSILVYSISFLAMQEPERRFPRYLVSRRRAPSPGNGEEIHKQLLAMMEQQKLYRNNNLRYSDLAARLGISVSQLSRLMNHEIGMSFNEFVNAYRVQDAKDRLSHNESEVYLEAFRRSDFEAMLNYYKASFPKPVSSSAQTSKPSAPPRRVQCSTLGIFGLQDKALLPSGWNGTWEWIDNNVTLVSLPTAGHFVQQDAPEMVTRTIKMWLNR